ncbi:MAG: alpha/beta fold hydrolase [Candidatus Limnocylindrales bacterium]
MRQSNRVILATIVASTLVASLIGCSASSGTSGPNGTPASAGLTAGPGHAPTSARLLGGQPMTLCTVGDVPAICGMLQVPEDPAKPAGRQVGLHVAVVPTLAAVAAPDPLFALAGGPGGAASEQFGWLPGRFADIHATRDIVLVDQRGTGGSNPLTLPNVPDTSGLSAAQASAALVAWAKTALAALDADPRTYTSSVAADDLDAVRAALGYDRIDLYGPSYGGTLAQYYLRQFSQHVRVAVLDGSTPLDVPLFERVAPNSQHALDLVLQRCAADAACHAAYPNPAGELAHLLSQLARPITTNIKDPVTGASAVIDKVTVELGIHQALLTSATAALLPQAIHLADTGRWDLVAELMATPSESAPNLLMAQLIRCSESWARFDPAITTNLGAGSYVLDAELDIAQARAAVCRVLPRGEVPADDAAPVRAAIPVLWVVGDADPQDPPANLAAVPSQLTDSRIVVVPGQGHTVGHLGCMPSIIGAFVVAGSAAALDTSCVEYDGVPTPTFAVP